MVTTVPDLTDAIFTSDSYNLLPLVFAERFARSYWDKPRPIENWNADDCTFSVKDGTHLYRVVLVGPTQTGFVVNGISIYAVKIEKRNFFS